jgi:hypothetical protein
MANVTSQLKETKVERVVTETVSEKRIILDLSLNETFMLRKLLFSIGAFNVMDNPTAARISALEHNANVLRDAVGDRGSRPGPLNVKTFLNGLSEGLRSQTRNAGYDVYRSNSSVLSIDEWVKL